MSNRKDGEWTIHVPKRELAAPINAGDKIMLKALEASGLGGADATSIPYYVRESTTLVHQSLSSGNALLSGPPGSGKSTSAWLWVLRYVAATCLSAFWYHFDESGANTWARFSSKVGDDQVTITYGFASTGAPFTTFVSDKVDVCVIDGLRAKNLDKVKESWDLLRRKDRSALSHMVWISSEQVLIPIQSLQKTKCNASDMSPGRKKSYDSSLTNLNNVKKWSLSMGSPIPRASSSKTIPLRMFVLIRNNIIVVVQHGTCLHLV